MQGVSWHPTAYSLWAKSVNKVLSEYNHTLAFLYSLWLLLTDYMTSQGKAGELLLWGNICKQLPFIDIVTHYTNFFMWSRSLLSNMARTNVSRFIESSNQQINIEQLQSTKGLGIQGVNKTNKTNHFHRAYSLVGCGRAG